MSCISFPHRHLLGLGRPFITPSQARTSGLWLPSYGRCRMGPLQPYSVVWARSRRKSVHKLATMATMSSINDARTAQIDSSHLVAQNLIFTRLVSMALQTVLKLGIPDILASAEGRMPMSAEEILRQLPTKSTPAGPIVVQNLQRLLRPLVREGVFSESLDGDEQPVYGLTEVSQWFVRGNPMSVAPFSDLVNSSVAPPTELCLPEAVLDETTNAFTNAFGVPVYEFDNPEFRVTFQKAMAANSNVVLQGALDSLLHSGVLDGVNTLVDVGGSTGCFVSQVVAHNPHIQGINFDLPYVIATAPANGVQHVGGSFFDSVPSGDAMFLKWILHNYRDEEAIQILKNCWKALPAKNGKIIVAEFLRDKDDNNIRGKYVECMDLIMLTYLKGARERSREEYQAILGAAGFSRCNLLQMSNGMAMIEGFKE